MIPVFQTDFSSGTGNALQACIAAIFDLELTNVPNFITAPDYIIALQEWLKPRQLSFLKVDLDQEGCLQFAAPTSLCILAGQSPRGNFRHAVVGQALESGKFKILFDPHPENTGLIGVATWAGFFVLTNS